MKIQFRDARYRSNREGIEIYPLPTIQLIFNEYGESCPKWEVRIWWVWFRIELYSNKKEAMFKGM